MKTSKNSMLASQHADCIELLVDERHMFCLYVLENSPPRPRRGEMESAACA
jgi:alpha-glucosidase